MSRKFPLLLIGLVLVSDSAFASDTKIVRASLSWDHEVGLDVIAQSTGFSDDVPNLGKTEYADAVKVTTFCFFGSAEDVCKQVVSELERSNRQYVNGDHMGLSKGTCTVKEEQGEKIAVATYKILDDYVGNFEVTRKIAACNL